MTLLLFCEEEPPAETLSITLEFAFWGKRLLSAEASATYMVARDDETKNEFYYDGD